MASVPTGSVSNQGSQARQQPMWVGIKLAGRGKRMVEQDVHRRAAAGIERIAPSSHAKRVFDIHGAYACQRPVQGGLGRALGSGATAGHLLHDVAIGIGHVILLFLDFSTLLVRMDRRSVDGRIPQGNAMIAIDLDNEEEINGAAMEALRADAWFTHLHERMTQQGFGGVSKTSAGIYGWFIDPEHLVEHLLSHGVDLKWAYRPEDPNATTVLDMSIDVMAHCLDELGSTHSFVGAFASRQATFLLFADRAMFDDSQLHLAVAFCVPGDRLDTSFEPVPTHAVMTPWVDDDGMVNCLEFVDQQDGLGLVSMGAPGRGRDLQTIFVARQDHIERARASAQRQILSVSTPGTAGGRGGVRL